MSVSMEGELVEIFLIRWVGFVVRPSVVLVGWSAAVRCCVPGTIRVSLLDHEYIYVFRVRSLNPCLFGPWCDRVTV